MGKGGGALRLCHKLAFVGSTGPAFQIAEPRSPAAFWSLWLLSTEDPWLEVSSGLGGDISQDCLMFLITRHKINLWNLLPQDLTEAKRLAGFKTGLAMSMNDEHINSYTT